MACRIEIKKNLTSDIEEKTNAWLRRSPEAANQRAREINREYKANVVSFYIDADMLEREIHIPNNLIEIYYQNEIELERREVENEELQKSLGNDFYMGDDALREQEKSNNVSGGTMDRDTELSEEEIGEQLMKYCKGI